MVNLVPIAFALVCAGLSDPIVPFDFKAGDPGKQVEALKTLHREFGLRRFVLTAPGTLRPFGRYDEKTHAAIGESLANVRKAFAGTDVEIGWWDYPTIRGGFHERGQHILDCDGNACDALCPLDEEANAAFLGHLRRTMRAGRPSVLFIEDDFTLSNHAGLNAMKGCFCPLHLAAYARRTGLSQTAAEIAAQFRNPDPTNETLRRAFADISRESLVSLAKRIRAAVDEVDPKVRICLCQSGFVDVDGDSTEAVARALAGGTRPLVRIFGAGYFNENRPSDLPVELAHAFWSAAHLPPDFELLHESDPYPHSRFYNSTRFLMSEVFAAFMAGVDDSFLYCTAYSDDPLCDTAYAAEFNRNRARLATVREFRRRSSLVGIRAAYDPEEVYLVRATEKGSATGMLTEDAYFLARHGFPMTTAGGSASVLFGSSALHLSEARLREILSGAVLVDAEAAVGLVKRGLGDLLGCSAVADDGLRFYLERTLPAEGLRKSGTNPYHHRLPGPPILGWTKPPVVYARLVPSPGSETLAVFEDQDGKTVAPSFVFGRNRLGGRVGTLAFSVGGNRSPALYSPLKQELFRAFFVRATDGALDVCAPRTPGTWVVAAVSDDGRQMMAMVNNLAGEPRDDIALELSARWRGRPVSRLDAEGRWKPLGVAGDRLDLGFACEPMVPEFLLFGADAAPATADPSSDRETYLFRTMEHPFPKIRKVGAVSPNGECTPFVFRGRRMRMELFDPARDMDAREEGIRAVIRDAETGEIVGRTGRDCFFHSLFADGEKVYVTGVRRDKASGRHCGDTIMLFESTDLVNWTERVLLRRPGWHFFNTTLAKGPDGYVLGLESDDLKHASAFFTMFFATSKDLKEWTFMPDDRAYPKHRYCGGPFLVHRNGFYYLSLVTEMPCERYCTYVFRTRDFTSWECSRYNPFLMWDDDDRRVAETAHGITPEFAQKIRTGFVCNASDLEMCEFGGRTCLNYLVGDQHGFYYTAEAWYDGPMQELLERLFE